MIKEFLDWDTLMGFLEVEWDLGFKDRGMDHGDYSIMAKKNNQLIIECPNRPIAEHIIQLHNSSLKNSDDPEST